MLKTGLIRIVLVIVAIAMGGGIWIVLEAPKPLNITVTFTGYTNDAFGDHRATFVVTNHTDVSVRRWKGWLVERPDGAPPQSAFFAVELIPTPRPPTGFLAPGQSEFFTLPIPTNQTTWRALIGFTDVGWKYRYAMWRAGSSKTRDLADSLHVPYPALPHQFFASDWIEK